MHTHTHTHTHTRTHTHTPNKMLAGSVFHLHLSRDAQNHTHSNQTGIKTIPNKQEKSKTQRQRSAFPPPPPPQSQTLTAGGGCGTFFTLIFSLRLCRALSKGETQRGSRTSECSLVSCDIVFSLHRRGHRTLSNASNFHRCWMQHLHLSFTVMPVPFTHCHTTPLLIIYCQALSSHTHGHSCTPPSLIIHCQALSLVLVL